MMLNAMPRKTEIKNDKLTCVANCLNFPVKKSLKATRSKDLIESINSSNIPVIIAIVPPDTPGITFAAPMPIPLKNRAVYLRKGFIYKIS